MKQFYSILKKVFPIKEILKSFPCELFLLFSIAIHDVVIAAKDRYDLLIDYIIILPLLISLLFCVNMLTQGKKTRFIYLILGIVVTVLTLFTPFLDVLEHTPIVSEFFYSCMPFALVFLARRSYKNSAFANDLFLHTISWVIFFSVFFSAAFIVYFPLMIIDIFANHQIMNIIGTSSLLLFLVLFLPFLFFTQLYHAFQHPSWYKNKLVEVIVNYLISLIPIALMLLLTIWSLAIAFRGDFLPNSSLRGFVLSAVLLLYITKAIRSVFEGKDKKVDLVFKYVGWLTVIPIILYWVAMGMSIPVQGFMEINVLGFVFGSFMTLLVLADLTRKCYNYYLFTSVIAFTVLLMATVPFCNPGIISTKSHINKLKEYTHPVDLNKDLLTYEEVEAMASQLDETSQKRFANTVQFIYADSVTMEAYGIQWENYQVLKKYAFDLRYKLWSEEE